MKYTIDNTLTEQDNPERIQAWLRNHGYPDAEVISTAYNRRNGNVRIVVESSTDPTPTVDAYTPTPTQREIIEAQLLADARQAIIAIRNKGPNNWTTQDKIILAMALSIRDLQG